MEMEMEMEMEIEMEMMEEEEAQVWNCAVRKKKSRMMRTACGASHPQDTREGPGGQQSAGRPPASFP